MEAILVLKINLHTLSEVRCSSGLDERRRIRSLGADGPSLEAVRLTDDVGLGDTGESL